MRKRAIMVVLAVLMLTGGWLVMGSGAPIQVDGASARAPIEVVVRDRDRDRDRATHFDGTTPGKRSADPVKPGTTAEQHAALEREHLRQRIRAAQLARERAAQTHAATQDEGPPVDTLAPALPATDDAAQRGGLSNPDGNLGYLSKVMNEELLPLTDECYALARETQPELMGILEMNVELIEDQQLGGVVETVEPGPGNELRDPGLIECVRESLLSITLPPPPTNGRESIVLSLRLDDEP